MLPNNEVIKMHSCCYGNKILLATRNIRDNNSKQTSYKEMSLLHSNKVF